MDISKYASSLAVSAKDGGRDLARCSSRQKSLALMKMAELIRAKSDYLMAENLKDIENARAKGLSSAMIDRLRITEKTIIEMSTGIAEIAAMNDPVGEIVSMWSRPNGMKVGRMRVPIGCILIIYESRPNVTADAAALCLKAGNSVILRGGSEAVHSNVAIAAILREALAEFKISESAVTFVENTDRAVINELLKLSGTIDLVIPRGGEGLIRMVADASRIPVLKHFKGVCHTFVDRDANIDMALDICHNAKVQRPGTCNAMETMLVDMVIADQFIPEAVRRFTAAGVQIFGCPVMCKIYSDIAPYSEDDLYNEYLDLRLNIRVVNGIEEAIAHINKYSSSHTDAIVTENFTKAMQFLNEVDSSAVLINASTRLHDGGQFGLGAEIGISTDKLHARGTMGLNELTCLKYIVIGNGQLRQ